MLVKRASGQEFNLSLLICVFVQRCWNAAVECQRAKLFNPIVEPLDAKMIERIVAFGE